MTNPAVATLDLARGELHPDDIPTRLAQLEFAELLRAGWNYSDPAGSRALRGSFVGRLARIARRAEDTLVTHGALGALDLAFAALRPRRLRVFDPTYREAVGIARAHGLPVAPLPDPGQVSVADLAPGDLVYLVPTLNNPDGRTLDAGEITRLVDVLTRSGTGVIEDDPYWPLDDTPSGHGVAAAMATAPRLPVLRLQSFSKILCPGARCCVVEGTPAAVAAVAAAKRDFGTSPFASALVDRVLADDDLFTHVHTSIAATLRTRRSTATAALAGWPEPIRGGGYFLWLPTGQPDSAGFVADAAARVGVIVADGGPFHVQPPREAMVRISVAWERPERLGDACRALVAYRLGLDAVSGAAKTRRNLRLPLPPRSPADNPGDR